MEAEEISPEAASDEDEDEEEECELLERGVRVEIVQGDLGRMDTSQLCWARGLKCVGDVYYIPFAALPRYVKLEWLSAGAQGAIVKAYDTKRSREVAIKMLCCESRPRHVLRELRTMSLWLKHANLTCATDLYYHFRKNKLWVYIVMPLMAGSLDQWLDQFKRWRATQPDSPPVPPDTVAMISYQSLRGLFYLHSGGVHHRDLATKNILYQPVAASAPIIEEEGAAQLRVPPAVQALLDALAAPDGGAAREARVCAALAAAAAARTLRGVLRRHAWDGAALRGLDLQTAEGLAALRADVARTLQTGGWRGVDGDDAPQAPSPAATPPASEGYRGPPLHIRVAVTDFGLSRSHDREAGKQAQLTDYVVTRFYRAPELILGQGLGAYNPEKIDVWSLGCVVGELVAPRLEPFLPGRSAKEQMEYIFLLLGVPEPDEVKGFSTNAATDYVRSMKERTRGRHCGTDFAKFFAGADADCVEALRAMLVLNPNKRATADELLDLPFFRRGAELCGSTGDPVARHRLDAEVEERIKSPGRPETSEERKRRHEETRQLILEEVMWMCICTPLSLFFFLCFCHISPIPTLTTGSHAPRAGVLREQFSEEGPAVPVVPAGSRPEHAVVRHPRGAPQLPVQLSAEAALQQQQQQPGVCCCDSTAPHGPRHAGAAGCRVKEGEEEYEEEKNRT